MCGTKAGTKPWSLPDASQRKISWKAPLQPKKLFRPAKTGQIKVRRSAGEKNNGFSCEKEGKSAWCRTMNTKKLADKRLSTKVCEEPASDVQEAVAASEGRAAAEDVASNRFANFLSRAISWKLFWKSTQTALTPVSLRSTTPLPILGEGPGVRAVYVCFLFRNSQNSF